jgi:Leucine-rich repeat (LRR) protein
MFTRDVRDVKRLYLSGTYIAEDFVSKQEKGLTYYVGNAIKSGFFEEHCYNLVYLELAACRLTALPEELASLAPNLRVLNLNYNFLEDVRPLEGLTRLKKLTIIGSRLKGTKALIRLLQRTPEVEMLDFRQVSAIGFTIIESVYITVSHNQDEPVYTRVVPAAFG